MYKRQTQQAVREGASEVDMVVNLGDVKNGDFDAVEKEIAALKQAAGHALLKVIIETVSYTHLDVYKRQLQQR